MLMSEWECVSESSEGTCIAEYSPESLCLNQVQAKTTKAGTAPKPSSSRTCISKSAHQPQHYNNSILCLSQSLASNL